MRKTPAPANYVGLLKEIKARIAQAQSRAVRVVNAELVRLYWDIGRLIHQREIRCPFISSGKNDELTPDFPRARMMN